MVVVLSLGDERHVTLVQEKSIGQRQGFIVKAVDVASKAAAFLPYSRAQGQPTRQPQNRNGPGNRRGGRHIGFRSDGVVIGKRRSPAGLSGVEHDNHPHQFIDRFQHRVLNDQGGHSLVPVAHEQHGIRQRWITLVTDLGDGRFDQCV